MVILFWMHGSLTPTEHFVTLYFRDFITSTNPDKFCCHIHMVIFWVMLKWSITNRGEAWWYCMSRSDISTKNRSVFTSIC